MIQFHPEFYTKNKETAAELQKASLIRLSQVFKILDEALQEGPFFFGDELTILDFLLAMQTTWTEIFPNGINQYKNLNRHMQTITDRNAVRSILIKHNIN
jgi:glutathione S-transferase